jgi:hypothetical protein
MDGTFVVAVEFAYREEKLMLGIGADPGWAIDFAHNGERLEAAIDGIVGVSVDTLAVSSNVEKIF